MIKDVTTRANISVTQLIRFVTGMSLISLSFCRPPVSTALVYNAVMNSFLLGLHFFYQLYHCYLSTNFSKHKRDTIDKKISNRGKWL